MSKFSTSGVVALNASINFAEQKRILKFMNNHLDSQAALAKKEYNRFNLITLMIIFFVFGVSLILSSKFFVDNHAYPNDATKEVYGHISLYEDTFWYTDNSQKYEFDFDDYNIDESYKPGEIVLIYLDDSNNIISVMHKTEDYGLYIKLILLLSIMIVLIFFHIYFGRKIYAKNFVLYVEWYKQEIEPYIFMPNFEEIVKEKKFYNVTVDIESLDLVDKRLYKKYRNRNILFGFLFVGCIALIYYIFINFNLNVYSWLGIGIIFICVLIFYILINNCSVKMDRIKKGYYKKSLRYFCDKCNGKVEIQFKDIEKFNFLPKNKNGIRFMQCPHCDNNVLLYNFDATLADYKKYLSQTQKY